uniref:procollagen-proline 3-dioxygenase n=1 Tax=Electrophorus electricus TaxID=8005 RepID=A0A4W4FK62_ELEEL
MRIVKCLRSSEWLPIGFSHIDIKTRHKLAYNTTLEPYDLLYHNGIEAFSRGDYTNVVRYMEKALRSFSEVHETKIRCRLKCKDQHSLDRFLTDLQLFDVILRRAACLNDCTERKIGPQSMHKVTEEVTQDFNRRVPYNYLQLAYQKLKQLDKAAAAAHTYFQANPEHVEMIQDLEQYKALEGVEERHFINREARPHQKAFSAGAKLYDKGEYGHAAVLFEEALAGYYQADMKCRALCEGPQHFEEQDHTLYRYSLYELISDHYTQILHCQHECIRDLATRPGRLSPMENYLPLHYDYLQFAYFQENKLEEALVCALTYLLFHEGEEFMTENVEYYTEILGSGGQPRQMWLLACKHKPLEHRAPDRTVNSVRACVWVCVCVCVFVCVFTGGPLLYDSVRLVLNSGALNGTQRAVFDDVISEDQCSELQHLTATIAGDGYRGKMSPHTPNEKFEGTTVLKTLQYGYEGRVPLGSARLFYDISEKARQIIESYFMLSSTLHFSYTHLVCRTAIPGQQELRNDLSHPIHADNCLLDPEANECWKEPPAYTYRDYSALLYLNGDFDGGEFIFTEMDAKTVKASVKPRCGRMVGFSSGGENPHGVRAVTRGQRCALAMWFTLDPLYRELERLQADEVIQALQNQLHWAQDHINPKDEL